MQDRFVSANVNLSWVIGGAIIALATVFATASRSQLGIGITPSVLLALGIIVLGVSGRGEKSLAGDALWGRLVFIVAGVWVVSRGYVQSGLYSAVGPASGGWVVLVDLVLTGLAVEAVRRGGKLDRRLWVAGMCLSALIVIAELVPVLIAVATPGSAIVPVLLPTTALLLALGLVAIGGLLVFAGASQDFKNSEKPSQSGSSTAGVNDQLTTM